MTEKAHEDNLLSIEKKLRKIHGPLKDHEFADYSYREITRR